MDPMQTGATAAIVSIVLGAFKLVESISKKKNGAGSEVRLALIEESQKDTFLAISELRAKVGLFHREFLEFRESQRVITAQQETREKTLREIKNG
jgi:hypothetical protein